MRYNSIYIIMFVLAAVFSACDEYEDTETLSPAVASNNDGVRFAASNLSTINVLYNDLDFTLTVIRNSTTSAITVPVSAVGVDGEHFELPANIIFPAGEDTVAFDLAVKETAPQGVNLALELMIDESFTNPYLVEYRILQSKVFVKPPCQYNEITIDFLFDGYASETTWSISDSDDEVVASGGPYEDGLVSESIDVCLEDGSYTFTVNDSYGDGLTYPNLGLVTIVLDDLEIVNIPGNFGETTSVDFTLGE